MARVLVIGYGNRLRGDDGVGIEAAERVAELYRDEPQVRVLVVQQLVPELASDMAEADFVLLLDAEAGDVAGMITRKEISAEPDRGSFTHQFTPAALLGAAAALYGRAPAAVCLTMSAREFDLGEELSATIRDRLGEFTGAAQEIVAGWLEQGKKVVGCQALDGNKNKSRLF